MDLAIVLLAVFLNQVQSGLPPPELAGDTLAFELPDLDGNVVSSSDERFKNKVVLVDLWGTWCPPCRKAVPFLGKLHERYQEDGLVVVGIAFERHDSAEGRRAAIRGFAEERHVDYMLLDGGGDPDSALKQALPDIKATRAFPTMFIIGREGRVEYSKSGFRPADEEAIEAKLREILSE